MKPMRRTIRGVFHYDMWDSLEDTNLPDLFDKIFFAIGRIYYIAEDDEGAQYWEHHL